MYFKPLTDDDRKNNEKLDHINHAPYFTIFLIAFAGILIFTILVLFGIV
jgi:hypothetical protein